MDDQNITEKLVYRKNIEKCSKDEGFKSIQYEKTAVEGFGMALLKKMGLQKDLKIGRTNAKRVEVKAVNRRPDRVGLGSGPKLAKKNKRILQKDNVLIKKPKNVESNAKSKCDKRLNESHIIDDTAKSKKIEWAAPNLVVVVIEHDLKFKKFFNKLAIIVDVISYDNIMLKIIENNKDEFYAKNTLINSFLIIIMNDAFP